MSVNNEASLSMGAQDHIMVGCNYHGFLRKQGRLERIFPFLRWRQRFMVVSSGWLYIFRTELSSGPLQVFHLSHFTRLERFILGDMKWIFRLLPHDPVSQKILLFSCSSDTNRKEWMAALKKDILLANSVKSHPPSEDPQWDDYIYLETDVPREAMKAEFEEDLEQEYNVIDGELPPSPISHVGSLSPTSSRKPKRPTFIPELPGTKSSYTPVNMETKQKKVLPVPASPMLSRGMTSGKASKTDKRFLRSNFEFTGLDRDKVGAIIMSKQEGTFLVRRSRSDDKEVLSVNIAGMLKEFKIYVENDQVSLDNKVTFDSVEDLLRHYSTVNLPGHPVTLRLPYRLAADGYVNERIT